jgi:hypothetical protein
MLTVTQASADNTIVPSFAIILVICTPLDTLTIYTTNSMEQSTYWEADSCSCSHESSFPLRNLDIHYHCHKRLAIKRTKGPRMRPPPPPHTHTHTFKVSSVTMRVLLMCVSLHILIFLTTKFHLKHSYMSLISYIDNPNCSYLNINILRYCYMFLYHCHRLFFQYWIRFL